MSSSDFDMGSDDWASENQDDEDPMAILLQNTFYQAQDIKKNRPEAALQGFLKVLELQREVAINQREWSFKALQNIVLLQCALGRYQIMCDHLNQLMGLMDTVARNDATKAINSVLDASSKITDPEYSMIILQMTVDKLKQSKNVRLIFNTQSKLAKIYLDRKEIEKAEATIQELIASCKLPNGADDPSKTQFLIEAYAYQIQLCNLTKDAKRMKEVTKRTEELDVDLSDPRILGVIKENIGLMYMQKKDWSKAQTEQFQAFKSYQEVGNPRAKTLLKYVVLTSILSNSDINPFHSQEAKVYKDDPQINKMIVLRKAFEQNNVNVMQQIVEDRSLNLLEDPNISIHVEDLFRVIRLVALTAKISPYKIVKLDFLAAQLKIAKADLVSLLVQLIMDNKISAQIDEIEGIVEMQHSSESEAGKRDQAYKKWIRSISSLHSKMIERVRT